MWSNRHFTVFWAGQTLSELGNAFALVALPLLVLHATGSVAQMGLLTAVAGAGSLGAGLFAGVLVDRVDRRRLMIRCDLARVALYGAIPVCWLVQPQVWLLYAVTAVASVVNMVFQVAYVTAVPALVDADRIVAANGRLESSNAVSYIAGPLLAGVVSGAFGPASAIAVDAATFAVSAVALAFVRLRAVERPSRARDLRADFLAGFGFLWRTPVLRWLAVLLSVITFLSLGMIDVFVFHVRDGLGQTDGVVGVVLGLAGVGTVLAAASTPLLRRRYGFGPCWLGSYVLCAAAVAVVAWSGSTAVVAGAVLAYAFGMALAGISSMSLRQAVTPDHLLGRVTSAFWTVHTALAPLGAGALTALVAAFGVRIPLLGAAAVLLLVVAVGLFTPISQRRPERSVA